jgi:hypothetical protein
MAQTSAGRGPIPPAKKDDSEDVAWALSTAEAMYARGDRGDALKWLRRAADAASETAKDRAVELSRAAATFATSLGAAISTPPLPPRASMPAAPLRIEPPRPRVRPPSIHPVAIEEDSLDVTPRAAPAAPPASSSPTPLVGMRAAPRSAPPIDVDSPDGWESVDPLLNDDPSDPPEEKTRIGVPAYEANAKRASESLVAARPVDPALRPSQALRVVVWRAADGVHVAPQGTRVAAISVDAVLVSLDPTADLAAWLSNK